MHACTDLILVHTLSQELKGVETELMLTSRKTWPYRDSFEEGQIGNAVRCVTLITAEETLNRK